MQIELWKPRADLLSLPREQRQNLALEALGEIAHARAAHDDCSAPHRKPTSLPIAIAASGRQIDGSYRSSAPMPDAAEERGHFLLQEFLQLGLDLPAPHCSRVS